MMRYSAEDLSFCASPPEAGEVLRVRDVLVVEVADVVGDVSTAEEYQAHPPAGCPRSVGGRRLRPPPFELGRGVTLGRLERHETDLVRGACEMRGHFFRPVHGGGVRYAYARDVTDLALDAHGIARPGPWDGDRSIAMAVAISRWLRDNATGADLAARIVDFDCGQQQVIPHRSYESGHAYRLV
jgi:hypothetical protein